MTEKYDAHIDEVLKSLEVNFNDKIYNIKAAIPYRIAADKIIIFN